MARHYPPVSIFGVPTDIGAGARGASMGPEALRVAGLGAALATRGVDVGARAEIYALMNRLTAGGLAVLMISSDLPEVLGMADRIVVLREGRTTGELLRAEATAERVMALAS